MQIIPKRETYTKILKINTHTDCKVYIKKLKELMERENDNYEAMEKTIGETIENIIGKKTVKNKLQHLRNLENLFTPKTSGEQTEGASLIQR